MNMHLVLGGGPIGTHVATALRALGDEVVVATRSGTSLEGPATSLDATDAAALRAAADGVRSIIVCTNPPYHRWASDWPPIVAAVADAARATGAAVVMMGNLYPYGRPTAEMTAKSPEVPTETKGRVRGELWRTLREAHERGEFRAAEVRASDYFGPGATAASHAGAGFFGALVASKVARVVGDPRVTHAWAYLPDIAATLAHVARSDDPTTWGRVWLAPHAAEVSLGEFAAAVNEAAGSHGVVRQYPPAMVRALGLVSPLMREVEAVAYQHREPYLVDDAETTELLGLRATPFRDAVRATVASYAR